MKQITIVVLMLFAVAAVGKDSPDSRVKQVTSVFVAGNNQAAEQAREEIRKNKSCLVLATKADDADAVLAIDTDTKSTGSRGFGEFGQRDWIASGTLTLKSGDLVWSRSERFTDAPFRSGGKVAGKLLVNRLAKDACEGRPKAGK